MRGTLGIMTDRIDGTQKLIILQKMALEVGFTDVFVFTPAHVFLRSRTIKGYKWIKTRWFPVQVPWPDIIHDVGYYTSPAVIRAVVRLKSRGDLPFAGYGLGNKWHIHHLLMQSGALQPFLLPTAPFSVPEAKRMLDCYGAVMIKPVNGKGGQGIVRVSRLTALNRVQLQYSSRRTLSFPSSAVNLKLRQLRAQGPAIVQQWIPIYDQEERVFDIRVLVQKNGSGCWQQTASGIRRAQKARITSNVQTGAEVLELQPFLVHRFGPDTAAALHQQIVMLAEVIPAHLEQTGGKRLAELGIDLAVDVTGRLWILEVNVKPGKKLVRSLYGPQLSAQSIRNPLQYAAFLLANHSRDVSAQPGSGKGARLVRF
ncbi:YheC/YheD family endospore coat-associated protein [Paenibacillus sp. y28]|uniref:YheC/YheD family endospore coat-associated protein n=1 Tax=Paenibacillus sp. y28 TaxID=3129110 RepID=UPI0030193061